MDESASEGRFVLFRVGAATFGVELARVVGVLRPLPVTRVPHAPATIEGVMNLQHDIIPVLHMRRWLGLAPGGTAAGEDDRARFVLVEVDNQVLGLHVDSVGGIRTLSPEEFVPPPADAPAGPALRGVYETPEAIVAIPDLDQVLQQVRAESPGKSMLTKADGS